MNVSSTIDILQSTCYNVPFATCLLQRVFRTVPFATTAFHMVPIVAGVVVAHFTTFVPYVISVPCGICTVWHLYRVAFVRDICNGTFVTKWQKIKFIFFCIIRAHPSNNTSWRSGHYGLVTLERHGCYLLDSGPCRRVYDFRTFDYSFR